MSTDFMPLNDFDDDAGKPVLAFPSATSARDRKMAPILEGFRHAADRGGVLGYFDQLIAENTHIAFLHDLALASLKEIIHGGGDPELSAGVLRRITWNMSPLLFNELKALEVEAMNAECFSIADQIAEFQNPLPSLTKTKQNIPHSTLNL